MLPCQWYEINLQQLDYSVFVFLAEAQLTKIPTPTQGKEFCQGTICKLNKGCDCRWRLIPCHILAISALKQGEWLYQATQGTNKVYLFCIGTSEFQFLWSKQMGTISYWSCKPSGMLLTIIMTEKNSCVTVKIS